MERFNSFTSDQIMMNKRQVSIIMASMLLFCLFVFIVGFFLGKRSAIEDFSDKVTHHALHDQIDFLLTTQSLESSKSNDEVQGDNIIQDIAETSQDISPKVLITAAKDSINVMPIAQEPVVEYFEQKETTAIAQFDNKPQYAQLIGFGTKKAAQAFVARLHKHQIPVVLKTVMSKTASGKQRVWYQAITPTYQSTQELQEQVTKIKRLEHIRDADIKIITVK